jgi:signal transduction histidine kinase
MTLRLRVVLTTLLAGVPALIAMWLVGNSIRDARDDELFSTLVLAHFSSAVLEDCAASPPTVPLRIALPAVKRGVFKAFGNASALLVFTYDENGRSSQPTAPALSRALLAKAHGNSVKVGATFDMTTDGLRQLVLVLPPSRGPCALALVTTPRLGPRLPPADLLVPLILALAAGLVAIWPVVRRVRSMTLALRRGQDGAPLAIPRDAGRDELGELSRALAAFDETIQRQHRALVAREQVLLEFIENTTHDLATPLTVLQGNLSALAKEQNPAAVVQAMDEAQYIGALLGNLAISAKFEVGAQVNMELDLRDVVARVVDRYRVMASWLEVGIEGSTPDEDVRAWGDPTFTERALANLVENAMRHNARGGHVAVVLETEGTEFVLRVLDDGPGLSGEECQALLQSCEDVDAARTRGGRGLAIVVRVAQIQHWHFNLEPGPSGGLSAELRGPVKRA